jgi:hypothetical protein
MRKIAMTALAACACVSAPAVADEVWDSNAGMVVYLEDQGSTAVLQQMHPRYGELRVYVRGLGGNYDNRRGVFNGYWIATHPARAGWTCDVSIVMEDDQTSNVWGRVEMTFTTGGFPTGFVAHTGSCHSDATDSWTGQPR